jgi:sodium transport system permease protein
MRWSIIRLIWLRELRDQLRDRRTLFMIAVLPVLLYPILGVGVLQFALGFLKKQGSVGVVGAENLPSWRPERAEVQPLAVAAWLAWTPNGGVDQAAGALVLVESSRMIRGNEFPPLLAFEGNRGRFLAAYFDSSEEADLLVLTRLDAPEWETSNPESGFQAPPAAIQALESRQVDLLLLIPPQFHTQVQSGRPVIYLMAREDDDRSRMIAARVRGALGKWKKRLAEIRLLRQGLPVDFDEPFEVQVQDGGSSGKVAAKGLFDLMIRIFPFLLVMWSLAGALYPAIDLCAGEKERGTMETLLISPASREEIVYGKFLAIWVFSAATALLNLASMALTTWQFSAELPHEALRASALIWCVVLVLPLSAFFSALCLSIGAYARSSKEGQYYLMPLFLVTMPLIFLTLAPGVELSPFYSLVPVTGVALLLQRLMSAASLDQVPWFYFVPVLAPIVLYSWLALRWAVDQFQREEVLFREAERIDVRLWVQRLFRDKDAVPSAGQALFCFGLILTLRWLSFGFGERLAVPARIGVSYLAFVAAPPLLMALLLTTRPRQGLSLRLPTWKGILVAAPLALLLLPPLAGLALWIIDRFPDLTQMLTERSPLTDGLRSLGSGPSATAWQYALVIAFLPAVCEELAFRGFLLSGLRRRFRPWTAILLSSFMFALYHMNVFQFLPAFLLGVVLAILAIRTGSVFPGMLFHLIHNGLLISLVWLEAWLERNNLGDVNVPVFRFLWLVTAILCTAVAAVVLWRLSAFGYHRFTREDTDVLPSKDKEERRSSVQVPV